MTNKIKYTLQSCYKCHNENVVMTTMGYKQLIHWCSNCYEDLISYYQDESNIDDLKCYECHELIQDEPQVVTLSDGNEISRCAYLCGFDGW